MEQTSIKDYKNLISMQINYYIPKNPVLMSTFIDDL